METPQINLNGPGEYTLNIRQGTAKEERAPKSIRIDGTLTAPFAFAYGKRLENAQCHLRIYKDIGKLELHIQDTDPFTEHVIIGSLKRDSVLASFELNSDRRWTVQEFLKFIRERKYYFPDKDQHTKMIDSLRKWEAQIQTILKEHHDTQGNSLMLIEKKVSGVEMFNKFKLSIPIFQGYQKETFTVEIGLDVTSASVKFYLISDELFELETERREKIIDAEVKQFEEYTFSKVIVS